MPARKPFSNVTRASEPALLHVALVSALTAYDAREEAKARRSKYRNQHSHYALAHYLGGLERAEAQVQSGVDLRVALSDCFCGRLLDFVLRAIGEPKLSEEERAMHNRRWH